MFHRLFRPGRASSFFLFGARGTGKSTLLRDFFKEGEALFINLLDPMEEDTFARDPRELERRAGALPASQKWIVLDEVQKVPRLLDLVHHLIEAKGLKFALTGSSGRKLKRGASNLLAGRAFVHHLFPLTHRELGDSFRLEEVMRWGALPRLYQFSRPEEKSDFLRAYALTYLKEEIASERIIRNLEPFRNFLEIAAQCNGTILNFTRLANDVGVDTKTVQSYFTILEDTLLGRLIPAFHYSVRKRQRSNPKFYFFDIGIKRALERTVGQDLTKKTYAYGTAFEHFLILEIIRLAEYQRKDWTFSYLRTKDDAEIDLIIDRPGERRALVEIKSGELINERDVTSIRKLAMDIERSQAFCLSQDPHPKKIGVVHCLPWRRGLEELGL